MAIIFTRPDGGLSVVRPLMGLDRAMRDVPSDAIDIQVVEDSAIPKDRTFRNAWKSGAGSIEHDMAKCREIQKDKLRELRIPKLAALDMDYLRADEAANTQEKQRIAGLKQALRDVTSDPRIESAKTPEELKAVIPDILK